MECSPCSYPTRATIDYVSTLCMKLDKELIFLIFNIDPPLYQVSIIIIIIVHIAYIEFPFLSQVNRCYCDSAPFAKVAFNNTRCIL